MACDLTTGRAKGCKDTMAGLKTMYLTTDALGAITYDITDTDVITTFAGAPEFMEYDLSGDNNNADLGTWTSDPNNGTGYFAQSLNVQLNKLDKETHKEIRLVLYSNPTVVLQDYNGNFFVMGLENGLDSTGGTILTGGASGDAQGYTLTMVGKELKPANFIDRTTGTVTDLTDTTATVAAAQITP